MVLRNTTDRNGVRLGATTPRRSEAGGGAQMRKRLESMADRIEAVLSLHHISGRVTGGTVTPRWIRFRVLPAVGAKLSKIKGLSEELGAALDVPACRVSRRGAAVDVEVIRDEPVLVPLLPLCRQLTVGDGVPPATGRSTGRRSARR